MKPASASVISPNALGPCRAIGAFLAGLLAYLVRLQTSGQTVIPAHIAPMVRSADGIVYVFICNLAVMQLKSAGYTREADALRMMRADRPLNTSSVHAASASPAELIARLEATITMFEQAEARSEHLVRLMVCAHCLVCVDEPRSGVRVTAEVERVRLPKCHNRPAPNPWPPPLRIASPDPLAA